VPWVKNFLCVSATALRCALGSVGYGRGVLCCAVAVLCCAVLPARAVLCCLLVLLVLLVLLAIVFK